MIIPQEIIKQLREIASVKCVINNEELERLISTGKIEQYQVIDIRDREIFQKFRFSKSINIPFRELGKNLEKLKIDNKILIICNSGFTAAQSLSLLNSIGYQTYILEYGINGYLEEGENVCNNILRTA